MKFILVSEEIQKEHKEQFEHIEKTIKEALKLYENFDGIDFCDVNASGIQVRGHHKEVKNYSYGWQPTIKYDFSNVDEVIKDFIDMWKHCDTPTELEKFKLFIKIGEECGWD